MFVGKNIALEIVKVMRQAWKSEDHKINNLYRLGWDASESLNKPPEMRGSDREFMIKRIYLDMTRDYAGTSLLPE